MRLDGSRQITSYLLPGDALDLSDVPESMTDNLGTLSDCRAATLSRAAVAILKAAHPRIVAALMSSAHVDQAVAREWLTCVGRRSAEERSAHLICELLVRLKDVGLVEHDAFVMPLTQYDLADALGLSVVHVNRTVQLLRQRGLFVWKGRVVTILDRPGLLKLAEFDPRYLRVQLDPKGAPARAAYPATRVVLRYSGVGIRMARPMPWSRPRNLVPLTCVLHPKPKRTKMASTAVA